jgi:hypothetical protein
MKYTTTLPKIFYRGSCSLHEYKGVGLPMNTRIFFLLAAAYTPYSLFAANIIEKNGEFELNWSTMEVRFIGSGKLDKQDGDSYRPVEQRAWSDGLNNAKEKLGDVLAARMGYSGVASIEKLLSKTKSYSTTYYGDQTVRVVLEAPMAELMGQIHTPVSGSSSSNHCDKAVVVKLPKGTKPLTTLTLKGVAGEELLSPSTVSRETWTRQMMGRWYSGKSISDIYGEDASAFKNATLVEAAANNPKEFKMIAESGVSAEQVQGCLSQGKLAYLVP